MNLLNNIKENEGFRSEVYQDNLGFDTIGFGTKMPLDKDEAELILKHRLNKKIKHLQKEKIFVVNLNNDKQEVLYEMAYQLGVGGLLKFKRMWSALKSADFEEASKEMLDSRWARQTPARAKRLAERMRASAV